MLKENAKDVVMCSSSTNIAKENTVVSVKVKSVKKIGVEDTYNMEVEEVHNFVANNIIVHNSIDASRYLIAEWKDTNRCPIV